MIPKAVYPQMVNTSENITSELTYPTEQSEEAGELWGFGMNEWGRLGDGTTINCYQPKQIGYDFNWRVVSNSWNHTIGIKSDGTLWAWGLNKPGLLGDARYVEIHTPTQIGTEKDWKYISVAASHSLAIKKDGSLWAWGSNSNVELGDGTDTMRFFPVQIGKNLFDSLACCFASRNRSVAISADGSLWIWGESNKKSYPTKIWEKEVWEIATSVWSIKKDGTLWKYGSATLVQIGNDSDWVDISDSSKEYWLAIKKNGTLWGWGLNKDGQLGDGTQENKSFPVQIGADTSWKSIRCNREATYGLKEDGSLWHWGCYLDNQGSVIINKVPSKLDSNVLSLKSRGDYAPETFFYIKKHQPTLSILHTLPIIKITSNTAYSGGNILSDGRENIVRGVCFSRKQNPTIKDEKTVDGTGLGEYQSMMEGLKPYAKYYVRAYATNTVGTAYGQEETFTTKLEVPWLVSPKNNTNNLQTSISLIWEKVDFAQNYRLQLSKSPIFDSLLADETTDKLNFDYSKYKLNSLYYWRVQAINGVDSSDWSEQWAFSTSKYIPQELIAPASQSINVPIDCELIWKENIAGSKYNVQLSKDANFTITEIDTTISETNFILSKLDYLQLYNWRIRAVEGADSSAWSPVWKFTTLMDSVNLKTPFDLSKNVNNPYTLAWEEGIYKKDYRLQISESDDFATTNTDTLVTKTANADVKNLNYWQKYFWRVRKESGDTLGYWSQIWQFKTRLSDILLMYPENTQTGLEQEINFKWYPVIGAEYYQLQISKNDNFTDVVYSKDSITTTEKFVPALEKDILYYWRVRVWNTESIGTAYWSEVWTFTTGGMGVNDESDAIKIIPNPAGDFISVTLKPSEGFKPSEGSEIQIYNTLGEKVMSVGAIHELPLQRVNISDLPKGMYFVKVGGETAKFVKM